MATLLVAPPAALDEQREAASEPQKVRKADIVAQAGVIAILLAVPTIMCIRAACVYDNDLWWHLRTGQWMLQHHAVPHVDSYSRMSAGKPWEAYSWLYELLTFQLFQRFGLVGIMCYSAAMVLAITVAFRRLTARLQSDFTVVILLTFAGCFGLGHMLTPRPWLFTILFFVLEMDILMHARKTGQARQLLWLPVIFALWANTHIQFIYGLAALALALAESIATRWRIGETRLRAAWLGGALAASVAATVLNPYGLGIYRIVYNIARQPGGMNKISELSAIPFRDPTDYCVLLLALAAVGALAWSRRFQVFEVGLLAFGVVVSFRSQRDVWVVVTVAVAILASTITVQRKPPIRLGAIATTLAVVGAALLIFSWFRLMQVNNQRLGTMIAKVLPVDAVNEIRAKGYTGPLYNDFNWGGYLVWSLRLPVAIDGRGSFYGDANLDRSFATWNGNADWASDPQLANAGLVIGPVNAPLTQILQLDSHYKLVYKDKIAAVFVAQH